MLKWKVRTAEDALRNNIENTKKGFDSWFNKHWNHRTTREKMLSPESPLLHVYHKMCLPFEKVKELYLQSMYKESSDCGEKVDIWIETDFSFCNEYSCGMALCKKCAKKLIDSVEPFVKESEEESTFVQKAFESFRRGWEKNLQEAIEALNRPNMISLCEKSTQEKALSFLYGELRKAKIALGRAEGKPNSKEEQENLQNKLEAIDWILEQYFEGEKQ